MKVIYSTLDAVKWAAADPRQAIRAGGRRFRDHHPGDAVAIKEAAKLGLKNFTVLASHKVLMPALKALLGEKAENRKQKLEIGGELAETSIGNRRSKIEIQVDGFLCPGHASIILGLRLS